MDKVEVIFFDTEFTAWRGSVARRWSGPGEHKEIVQIGAVKVDAATMTEVASFEVLIRPIKNPILSDYLVGLTRISNERLQREGVAFADAIKRFVTFVARSPIYCYGRDDRIIAANAELLGVPALWPSDLVGVNLKDWLLSVGVQVASVFSGELAAHVGATSQGLAHDALVDARSLAEATRYLVARGAPNPFYDRAAGP